MLEPEKGLSRVHHGLAPRLRIGAVIDKACAAPHWHEAVGPQDRALPTAEANRIGIGMIVPATEEIECQQQIRRLRVEKIAADIGVARRDDAPGLEDPPCLGQGRGKHPRVEMVEDGVEEHGVELTIAKGQRRHACLDKTCIVQTVRKSHVTGRPYRMRIDVDARRRSGGPCQGGRDGPRAAADVEDVHGLVEKRQKERSRTVAALALKIENGVVVPHGGGRTIRQRGFVGEHRPKQKPRSSRGGPGLSNSGRRSTLKLSPWGGAQPFTMVMLTPRISPLDEICTVCLVPLVFSVRLAANPLASTKTSIVPLPAVPCRLPKILRLASLQLPEMRSPLEVTSLVRSNL